MASLVPFPAGSSGPPADQPGETMNPPQVVSLTWFITGGWTLLLVLGSVFCVSIQERRVDLELLADLAQTFLLFMLTMGSSLLIVYLMLVRPLQRLTCQVNDTFERNAPAVRSSPPGSPNGDRIPSINHALLKKRLVQAKAKYQVTFVGTYQSTSDNNLDAVW